MSKPSPLLKVPSSNPRLVARAVSLTREQWVPRPLAEVFPFFADAKNLEALTPPWLNFRIVAQPDQMGSGALIEYQLRLHGVPLRWRTLIASWEPPHRFVDEQLSGPYLLWHHEHTFAERDGGTVLGDHVRYLAPGGPLAPLIHRWLVRPDLERIFEYRRQVVEQRFGRAP
jgi:ligand-binding SRPBCC domain-containing protein